MMKKERTTASSAIRPLKRFAANDRSLPVATKFALGPEPILNDLLAKSGFEPKSANSAHRTEYQNPYKPAAQNPIR
ncbi:hypothetical protein [Actibacterium pelagium]|uniref:hypothetical protein n=1 Tax=Actibacterium pelagium TaxID=2029103 RepID=UPI0013041A10|nr:hypothetical protein [Actibacterium pelagium]